MFPHRLCSLIIRRSLWGCPGVHWDPEAWKAQTSLQSNWIVKLVSHSSQRLKLVSAWMNVFFPAVCDESDLWVAQIRCCNIHLEWYITHNVAAWKSETWWQSGTQFCVSHTLTHTHNQHTNRHHDGEPSAPVSPICECHPVKTAASVSFPACKFRLHLTCVSAVCANAASKRWTTTVPGWTTASERTTRNILCSSRWENSTWWTQLIISSS